MGAGQRGRHSGMPGKLCVGPEVHDDTPRLLDSFLVSIGGARHNLISQHNVERGGLLGRVSLSIGDT